MKWLESTATTRCTGGINISLLNQQKATAWFSFRHSLSKSYRRYITQNRVGWTLTSDHNESVAVFSLGKPAFVWQINSKTNLIQPTSPLFSFHLFFISPLLTGMMTVSHNAGQHEPGYSEQSAGRPVRLPLAPCCEHCSGGGTEWESGELLIPCTIGHLNPRQAPYLHWAKALPEPYDRAGRMITPRLAARDP